MTTPGNVSKKTNDTTQTIFHHNIIIGAGAAGLQAAYCLQKKNEDYLILDRSDTVGSHWKKFPRHRKLISINKPYVGSDNPDFKLRHDWNSLLTDEEDPLLFTSLTDELYPHADKLFEYFQLFQDRHQLNVELGVTVEHITKVPVEGEDDGHFEIRCSNSDVVYRCRYLFLGMGALPHTPDIPDIKDLPGILTYESAPLDREVYKNKRVLIVGKGNSGFETAEHISGQAAMIHLASPHRLSFAWNTHFVGDVRALHNNILDMYQLKSQHGILNGAISQITTRVAEDGSRKYNVTYDFSYTPDDPYFAIEYDYIILCTGYTYINLGMFDLDQIPIQIDEDPKLNSKYPKLSSTFQLEGCPNLYGIGPIMQCLQFHKNATGFIHGFRYNIRTLIEILYCRDHDQELPFDEFEPTAETLGAHIQYRLNTTSALYQQYNDLCDIVVLPKAGEETAKYFYELPLNFVKTYFAGQNYFVIYLDYGDRPSTVDVFTYVIQATPECPEKSTFLHPILRCFNDDGEDRDLIHILEALETIWDHPVHHGLPIREFVQRRLDELA